MKLLTKSIERFPIIYGLIVLFTSWTIYYRLPYAFFFYIILILATLSKYGKYASLKQTRMALLFFPVALRYFFPYSPTITSVGVAFINSLMVSCIFLLDEERIKKITDYIFKVVAIICLIGLSFHILRFLGIYNSPQIAHVDIGEREYSVFFLHVYEVSPFSGLDLSMRFNSIFDEPGYLGTIVALYLASRGFNLKNKWNIVLLIAGLFTLSLAFYIMAFAYLALVSFKGEGGYKRLSLIIFFIAILLYLFTLFFPELVNIFLSRQEFLGDGSDSRGGFAAMSRNFHYLQSQSFLQVLFGSGYDAHMYIFGNNTGELSQSNFFRLVFQIGFIGVFYLLMLFFLGIKKTYSNLVFFVVFLLSMYQRPQVIDPLFILIISGQMSLYNRNSVRYKRSKNMCTPSDVSDGIEQDYVQILT